MKRLLVCCCLAAGLTVCLLSCGCAKRSSGSELTVRTTGDAQVYGVYRNHLQ